MKIICMGDSLTKGYKIKNKESWVALVDSRSEHNWINQGILGDSSTGLLSRLERDCFSHNPQAAIIMAGTNDIIQGVSLPIIQSNMACIVHHCHHFNVSPYLGIPILADPELASVCWGNHIDFESVNRQLLDYRSWLIQFGEQFSCPVIDFQTGFSNAIAAAADKDWYLDGLHPTALGNKILVKSLPNKLYKTSS